MEFLVESGNQFTEDFVDRGLNRSLTLALQYQYNMSGQSRHANKHMNCFKTEASRIMECMLSAAYNVRKLGRDLSMARLQHLLQRTGERDPVASECFDY